MSLVPSNQVFRLAQAFAWLLFVATIVYAVAFWVAKNGPQGPSLAPEDKRLVFYAVMAGWVSLATFVVSAIGTASTILLGWRADKRQVAEAKLKIAQLELELFEARQKHVPKADDRLN